MESERVASELELKRVRQVFALEWWEPMEPLPSTNPAMQIRELPPPELQHFVRPLELGPGSKASAQPLKESGE